MRKRFKDVLIELAGKDQDIVFITGDLGFEFDEFKKRFPNRYFNFGVCEQSMISAAAGMALEGLKPYIYSITPFLLERPFEQVKIGLNQQKANVKLIGYADYPQMGPTHAELDWKIIGSFLKNTKCFFPRTLDEVTSALKEAHAYNGPAIISLKKAPPQN